MAVSAQTLWVVSISLLILVSFLMILVLYFEFSRCCQSRLAKKGARKAKTKPWLFNFGRFSAQELDLENNELDLQTNELHQLPLGDVQLPPRAAMPKRSLAEIA